MLLLLVKQESFEAKQAIKKAEELDPNMLELPLLWAQYYAADNEMDDAYEAAEKAETLRAENWHNLIQVGYLYKMVNRYSAMQRVAQKALDLGAPRHIIVSALGEIALEDDSDLDLDDDGDDDLELAGVGDFKLDSPELSNTLDNDSPSLLGEEPNWVRAQLKAMAQHSCWVILATFLSASRAKS